MAAHQVGETIRLNAAITDTDGNLGDPSAVKIKINNPDGTEAAPSSDMTRLSAGSYYYDHLILEDGGLGTYNWNVTATGSEGRITIVKDMFSVDAAI